MSLNIKNADGSLTKVAGKTLMNPVNNITTSDSLQDAPVGHILSYMGNTAPAHYLVCDGAEYNIADYLDLANHFKKEFGSVNYFGGDGTSTFAVPDLRGRMLLSKDDVSNIGAIGGEKEHLLSISEMPSHGHNVFIYNNNNQNYYAYSYSDPTISKDLIQNTSGGRMSSVTWNKTAFKTAGIALGNDYGTGDHSGITSYAGNSEAHNNMPPYMSVLFCIKYEPTYFMEVTGSNNDYSTEEQVIGKWIDGKPIYRKVYSLTKEYSLKSNTWTVIDDIDFTDKVPFDIKAIYTKNDSNGSTPNLAFYSFNKQLNIMNYRNVAQPLGLNHKIIIEYIKTTD